jgi:CHAD domain-containing protein/HD superfamily phosphodiesterase
MLQVLEECDRVATDFSADPVHDLRVALRRCRSLADGMIAMDPDPNWKAMKKAGRALFRSLGALRDVQIMMEWIEKLNEAREKDLAKSSPGSVQQQTADSGNHPSLPQADPAAQALLAILRHREAQEKRTARAALDEFDRKQWRQWSKILPARTSRIRPGSPVFRHLALERWTAARDLHTRAMRNRSQVSLHALRIGIKRFRYIVENFLPVEHRLWSTGLKHMQDLLGDVHDLDVLWATALASRVFPDAGSRTSWHQHILEERTRRVDEYRSKTIGPDSLWNVWRAGLPHDKQIRNLATQRMKLWAKALDPDFAHSERVARFSLDLYDGLVAMGLFPRDFNGAADEVRASLYAAALLHDVGRSEGNKAHHKQSLKLIQKHGTPLGWTETAMQRAAIVARFHCGALPTRSHKALRDLLAPEQKTTIQLSAVLRLANAFDAEHNGQIRKIRVENSSPVGVRINGFLRKPATLPKDVPLIITAEGFVAASDTAQRLAAERYLLETVLRRPIIVKAAPHPTTATSR